MTKKHKKLLKKQNVVLVYTGTKTVNGVDTGKKAIVIGVSKKVPTAELKGKDIVPKKIDGLETDVVEVGEIVALAVDRIKRQRPAMGGISIGHFSITAGTFGAIVRKGGERFILSNSHVLANMNEAKIGDDIYQPGAYDGGTSIDTIAELEAFVPIQFNDSSGCVPFSKAILFIANLFCRVFALEPKLSVNKVDCAIARPVKDNDVLDEILELGTPTGFGTTEVGKIDKKSGRTTAVTQGTVIATDAAVSVNYGGKTATFEDQLLYTAMSEGGDSGSVLVSENNRIVGLLFAGSDTVTIVNKISNVVDALGLEA